MRRALAILLMAVLALAPCSSMAVSQLLESHHSNNADFSVIASGHLDVGDNHGHERTGDHVDHQQHNGSNDCLVACDQAVSQVRASEDLMRLAVTRTSISVAYFALLASHDRFAVPRNGSGIVHVYPALQITIDSMSVLDRTARLRI